MNMYYSTLIDDKELRLEGQEAQHCRKVLRKKIGEHIHVMDGQGNSYKCQISEVGRNQVTTDIISRAYHEAPGFPIIAFGLIKSTTRMEWLLEKVTEIGVSEIIPLITERSERRKLKVERLEKVIISAAKQSLKYHLPTLHNALKYEDYINTFKDNSSKSELYIANYDAAHKQLWDYTHNQNPSVILIGPEGDFTTEEVDSAKSAGAIGVNLGPSRLRAETAAIVACAHLNSIK